MREEVIRKRKRQKRYRKEQTLTTTHDSSCLQQIEIPRGRRMDRMRLSFRAVNVHCWVMLVILLFKGLSIKSLCFPLWNCFSFTFLFSVLGAFVCILVFLLLLIKKILFPYTISSDWNTLFYQQSKIVGFVHLVHSITFYFICSKIKTFRRHQIGLFLNCLCFLISIMPHIWKTAGSLVGIP